MATEPRDTRGIRDDASAHTVTPVTDVFETELGCTIIAELPGVAPDRLDLSAERDTLTIRGRVSRPPRPPQHREFDLADYAQSFVLSEDLDTTQIRALLKDGVLRITIPKSETVKARRIQIQSE